MGVTGREGIGDAGGSEGSAELRGSDMGVRSVGAVSSAGGSSVPDGVGGGIGLSNPVGVGISTTYNEQI